MDNRPKLPFGKEKTEDWNKTSLTERWYRAVNTWCEMECQPDYDEDIVVSDQIVHWWYSPSKHHFTPFFPFAYFERSRPLLGVKDWIYMGMSVNGFID